MKKSTEFCMIEWKNATKSKIHSFRKKGWTFKLNAHFDFKWTVASLLVVVWIDRFLLLKMLLGQLPSTMDALIEWKKVSFNSIYSRGNQFCFSALTLFFICISSVFSSGKKCKKNALVVYSMILVFHCKWRNVDSMLLDKLWKQSSSRFD